jgi:hypothetical protein
MRCRAGYKLKRNDQKINSDKNLTVNKEERVANHPL